MTAHTQLPPDRDMLAKFSAAMFKHAGTEGYVSLRAFYEDDCTKPFRITPTSMKGGLPFLIESVEDDANRAANHPRKVVFCPPIAIFKDRERARESDILAGLALSVECDQRPREARATLEEILGPATLVVRSGGVWTDPESGEVCDKLHLHWRLRIPARSADLATLKQARDLAARLVGGDPSNKPVCHPIRWPGSWHRKAEPRLCEIETATEHEIDLGTALAALEKAAPAQGKANGETFGATAAPGTAGWAELVSGIVTGADYHGAEVKLASKMVTAGMTDGAVVNMLRGIFESTTGPRDARWQARYDDIPRSVSTAREKYGTASAPQPASPAASDPVDLWAKFDPPTLPRGVLPDVIERFAFDQGMTIGADMAGIAVGALVVCGAAIPDKIMLQVKRHDRGWRESARLWAALVGPVSAKKSPILSSVVRPLRRIDSEMSRRYSEERARYDPLSKEEKAKTPPPKHTRMMLQDTTMEAAQDIIKDSPDGVLSYQDELSGFFGSLDKYSGARGSAKDRAFWLQTYNGGGYSVDRVGRGSTYLPNLSVSILGGIQPEPIRQLSDDSMDDGLLQRQLPVVLRPAVEGRDEPQSDVVSEYAALINHLHGLSEGAAMTLRFDDGAQNLRQDLERRHLELQSIEAVNRKLAAHIGKYDGIFARLCVVFHCIENADGKLPITITEATARRAAGFLHGFLLPHALAFYTGTLGLSNDHDRLAAVAGYILARKLDRITNRDVQRGDRTMRGLKRQEIDAIFDQLDAFGWIDRGPGLRPTDPPRWTVNPAVHVKFAARADAEKGRRERDRAMIADLMKGQTNHSKRRER